jgi:hypothetical protein
MSKQKFRKFRKNDWSDEEFVSDRKLRGDKRQERRFERALRIKDFTEEFQETIVHTGSDIYEIFDQVHREGKF